MTLRICLVAAVVSLTSGGCAKGGALTALSAKTLPDSEWQFRCEACPGENLHDYRVRLHDDGTLSYQYPDQEWTHDGDDRWSVEGDELVISWSDGYSIERYPMGADTRQDIAGTKSNIEGVMYIRLLP